VSFLRFHPPPHRTVFTSPEHIHVQRNDGESKYWFTPMAPADNEDSAPATYESSETKSSPIWKESWKLGMSIVISAEPRLQTVTVTGDLISAQLTDGRIISVPLVWSSRLSEATPAQRQRFEIIWPRNRNTLARAGCRHQRPRDAARRPCAAPQVSGLGAKCPFAPTRSLFAAQPRAARPQSSPMRSSPRPET
jgi:hypothetical protein